MSKSAFGANQICTRHDVEGLALVIHRGAVRPGIVEGEAWRRGLRVDAALTSELGPLLAEVEHGADRLLDAPRAR